MQLHFASNYECPFKNFSDDNFISYYNKDTDLKEIYTSFPYLLRFNNMFYWNTQQEMCLNENNKKHYKKYLNGQKNLMFNLPECVDEYKQERNEFFDIDNFENLQYINTISLN